MWWNRARQVKALAACVAVLVVAALTASALMVPSPFQEKGQGRAVAAVDPTPSPPAPAPRSPVTTAAGPPPALIATLSGPLAYRSSPAGKVAGTLPANDPFGAANVLAVVGVSGSGAGTWLHVELPVRPNGSLGWVPQSSVSLSETFYRVAVSLSARTLTITNYGKAVLTTSVAVGKTTTPTPPDDTYLWELIRPDNPAGAYGPYIFGLGEFSDAYSVFNGGDAQIGIHGQDEPWSIGQAASNGCVRLPNDVISKLAGMLPLGTPVTIS
jgi:lipoprotein-anchoring transpeptidase ErfK/SrfK